jgi:hypothetical protein
MSVQKIYVLPVQRVSAQGRNNYDFVTNEGTSIPAGRTKSKGVVISMKFHRTENKLATGFDEMITNPFYGLDCPSPQWLSIWETIKNQQEINLQTVNEIKDNVAQGTYTSLAATPVMARAMNDIVLAQSVARDQTELEKFICYLDTEGTNVFDNQSHRGRMSIALCKNHPRVAASANVANSDIHEFYIGEEEEAIKQKVEKRDLLVDALANLGDLLKNYNEFTQQQVSTILKLLYNDASQAVTKSALQDFLFEERKNAFGNQGERIEKFNTVYNLLTKEPDRVYIKYLVEQAVKNYVILLDGGKYIWKSQRGIDNYYDLGVKQTSVENLFLREYETFDAKDANPDNAYYKLIQELRGYGVKVKEAQVVASTKKK